MTIYISTTMLGLVIGIILGKATKSEKLGNYIVNKLEKWDMRRVKLETEYRCDLGNKNPFTSSDTVFATPIEIRGDYVKLANVSHNDKPHAKEALNQNSPYVMLERLDDGNYSMYLKFFKEKFSINKNSRSSKLDNI